MNGRSGWVGWVADWPLWRSLRFRLMLLVLLASLPSLLLLLLTANQQRNDALDSGRDDATRIARLVAADQQAVSLQIGTVLNTLALNPDLQEAGACADLLSGVLDRSGDTPAEGIVASDVRVDGATFRTFAVVDPQGDVGCLAGDSEEEAFSADREVGMAAVERGRLVTGHLVPQPSGTLRVTYAVPLLATSGATTGALVATVDITALGAFAVNAALPDGTVIMVLDRAGERLQWYPPSPADAEPFLIAATPGIPELLGQQVRDIDEPVALDVEGESFVTGFDSTWSSDIDGTTRVAYTLVAIPEATVVRQASEKFNENLGKLSIAGLVGFVAAWVGADLLGGRDAGTRRGLIRDYYHIFETGQIDRLDQIMSIGYVDRSALPDTPPGLDGLRQNVAAFRSAFPDGSFQVRDLLADHDTVMARVTLNGTQVADYFGIPPGNQPVVADGVETFRFSHGMVVESWSLFGPLRPRDAGNGNSTGEPEAPRSAGWFARLRRRAPWSGGSS